MARFVCLLIFLACQSTIAQSDNPREYKIKVAYIYKIAHYVHIGNSTGLTKNDSLVIGILGKDPFGPVLDQIAKTRRIHSKKIVVKRFATWAEYQPCNILFVSKTADAKSVADAIQSVRGTPVLLVGEQIGFEKDGGVLNMYLDEAGKVGLKLNIDAAKRNNFRVDARLLQICDVIRDQLKNK